MADDDSKDASDTSDRQQQDEDIAEDNSSGREMTLSSDEVNYLIFR